jgi:hypothetical protein
MDVYGTVEKNRMDLQKKLYERGIESNMSITEMTGIAFLEGEEKTCLIWIT